MPPSPSPVKRSADSPAPCPFVWYDLITTDCAGAQGFYAHVLGWTFQAFPGNPEYAVASAGNRGVGGIMPIPAAARDRGAPACWQGYIGVPDVDIYSRRVDAGGGRVIQAPQDIPGVGRFAVAADPQGAVFILFTAQGAGTPSHDVALLPGTVGWHELHAGEGRQALDWYSDQFGWSETGAIELGPMGSYRLFATGGNQPVGGMMTHVPGGPGPFWAYYFTVAALDAALERVRTGGGTVHQGPLEVPGPMFIANCQDPQGAWFSLVAQCR